MWIFHTEVSNSRQPAFIQAVSRLYLSARVRVRSRTNQCDIFVLKVAIPMCFITWINNYKILAKHNM